MTPDVLRFTPKELDVLFDEVSKKARVKAVEECLAVVNQPNGVGDDDVIKISRDIKKHFGVVY